MSVVIPEIFAVNHRKKAKEPLHSSDYAQVKMNLVQKLKLSWKIRIKIKYM